MMMLQSGGILFLTLLRTIGFARKHKEHQTKSRLFFIIILSYIIKVI